MIAVDVRLYDSSSSSDFEEKKQTEVVIVLPSTDSCDKPKRYLVHLPVFVPAVTFVQAAFSVYYVGIMQNDIITIISSPLVFSPFRQTELWRFVTYMFVHDGMAHISLNTLFQLLIGVPLEGIHGWRKVVVVYFVGGAIGVLMGSNWHPFAYGMGSSGAIFVMVGCLLTTAVFHVALPSRGIRCGIAALCFMVIMFSVLQAEFLFTDQNAEDSGVFSFNLLSISLFRGIMAW
uniref:Peptidase S54 rhomboid domain-containing protein n=1 Tax=Plectus sambesii TaxID=2011161 RepID=A0A914XM26_9BILA